MPFRIVAPDAHVHHPSRNRLNGAHAWRESLALESVVPDFCVVVVGARCINQERRE
jgi:hypothetical protein